MWSEDTSQVLFRDTSYRDNSRLPRYCRTLYFESLYSGLDSNRGGVGGGKTKTEIFLTFT